MTNILILKDEFSKKSSLQAKILKFLPQAVITISRSVQNNWFNYIQEFKPKLIFLEIENCPCQCLEVLQHWQNHACETILVSSKRSYVFEALKYRISGHLLKPIDIKALKNTLKFVLQRIESKEKKNIKKQLSSPTIIGVPTMEGYEFLNTDDIIRCESYLKCTRVVTFSKTDIISSYNIGEFVKALGNGNFFQPHQSHLINVNKIKKYLKEGTIIMKDNSVVPISRRRKTEFLNAIPHI